jgi:DHA3 family macrolide efflux protein-like MFS transporter
MQSGLPLVIAIDSLTFFLCAAVLLFLSVPSPSRDDQQASGQIGQSLWADVREGAEYIGRRPPLLWLLATFAVANMAIAPAPIIVPLLVGFNLAPDWTARGYSFETALALLGVANGVGVLGGLAVTVWGGLKRRRVYGVLLPMLAGGILQAVYGLSAVDGEGSFRGFGAAVLR